MPADAEALKRWRRARLDELIDWSSLSLVARYELLEQARLYNDCPLDDPPDRRVDEPFDRRWEPNL